MNAKQREFARHALGLPNGRKQSYRNRYITTPKHDEWRVMVDAGEAEFQCDPSQSEPARATFWLTRKGAELALDKGETLDPEDFPAEAS